MIHWLWFHGGLSSGNTAWYLFPSGIGSILERLVELAVIGGILLRRHNCHERGCPRMGRFTVVNDGHHETYCHKHRRKRPGGDVS